MSKDFDAGAVEWQPVRPATAEGVWGKTLLDGAVKATLTRVAPGGKFRQHHDAYGHLFYFLGGKGVVQVGEKQIAAHAGVAVQVAPGEEHAYENSGLEDLVLISLNLPAGTG